jgi:hypothetical protein
MPRLLPLPKRGACRAELEDAGRCKRAEADELPPGLEPTEAERPWMTVEEGEKGGE